VVKVVFKTEGARANSGVVIRLPEPPPDPWYGVHNGYEVQIDAAGDEWHSTGAIYSLSKVSSREQKPSGEWNTMEIELRGPLTVISVNGKKVNEFREGQPVPERKMWYEPVRGPRGDSGYIGLQNHDARSTVYFKEVSVRHWGNRGRNAFCENTCGPVGVMQLKTVQETMNRRTFHCLGRRVGRINSLQA